MPASRILSCSIVFASLLLAGLCVSSPDSANAQQSTPIAIVPVEGVELTGAMDVAEGKAVIAASGSVTAGEHAATITLPHRGNLRLCATTKVGLTADSSVPVSAEASGAPGLMMALDRGAIEANFATGANSDVILTPDFRIIISGPGTAAVQVRLGAKGDTCVDNRGPNAPYVTVSSVFEGGVYRVQADQRVMFQHGSLREVVDNEKESCGCPPELPKAMPGTGTGNEFPVAQSAGLAPLPAVPPNAAPPGVQAAQVTAQLGYDGAKSGAGPETAKAAVEVSAPVAAPAVPAPKPAEKRGFFSGIGRFFRRLFGG
jgi:hypothetical protein